MHVPGRAGSARMLWSSKSDVGIGPDFKAPSQELKAKSPEDACSVNPVAGIRFQSAAIPFPDRSLDQSTEYFLGRRLEARTSASAAPGLF